MGEATFSNASCRCGATWHGRISTSYRLPPIADGPQFDDCPLCRKPRTVQVHWSQAAGRRRDTGTYIARVERLATGVVQLFGEDDQKLIGWSDKANEGGMVDVLADDDGT